MFRVLLSLATSLVALTPAAYADDFPLRKPGLWEISMNMGQGSPHVSRTCIDAATETRMRSMGEADMSGLCSRKDLHRSGDTLTADSVCRIGSSQVTSHAVTTMTGDAVYSTVTTMHYDPPAFGGIADAKTTQDAKWLGPCPSDMQPGDMIVDGHKMHIPTMMQGTHP